MSLDFRRNEVALTGTCGAEEALELVEWMVKHKRPKINLAACNHLHTALLQTLLAYKPAISAEPADPFLARWLMPLLAPSANSPKGAS